MSGRRDSLIFFKHFRRVQAGALRAGCFISLSDTQDMLNAAAWSSEGSSSRQGVQTRPCRG